jgi:predicted kinase
VNRDHAELTRIGIPTHDSSGVRLTRGERLMIWLARTRGVDFVYRVCELAGEVTAGRMSKREAYESLLFDYTPPTLAASTRREQ